MRLSEREARTLLFVRAVEDTDREGVLLPPRAVADATRRVFDEGSGKDANARLRTRASLLREELLREAPALGPVLDPPSPRGTMMLATLAVATAIGLATNLLGPRRHVSVLAFPLAGILLWNLAVYSGLIARVLVRTVTRVRGLGAAPSRLAFVGRWIERVQFSGLARRLGATTRSAAVMDAVERFQRLWVVTAAPLVAARARAVLHLAAFSMALGAILGMYVSGIAFEYRATWESTWLDTPAVQRYLDAVLAPASRLLQMPVPNVAPLRGPLGEGNAAPWIHLWAVTLMLFVLVPRLVLALFEALTIARLARWLPVDVDPAYVRRALHSGRGAATVVEIVYYSCAPDVRLREQLHTRLQDEAGARAVVRDGAQLDYGDGAEGIALGDTPGLLVVVFALAQTPEAEVHGRFLETLRQRADDAGWQIQVVLEMATYRQRVGSEERVRERRATWERLLRDVHVTAVELG